MSSIQIVNCIKINTEAIEKGLTQYVAKNGVDPSFIVVGPETYELLNLDSNLKTHNLFTSSTYETIWDIRIAVCDALKIGEVEIV